MSFWLDEDDNDAPPPLPGSSSQLASRNTQATSSDDFLCPVCGSSSAYEDATTGRLVCADCFTESQEPTQASQLEYEDVVGLAAKNKSGQFVLARRSVGGHHTSEFRPQYHQPNPKKPLEELDSSQPLPTVDTCVEAYQTILFECTERLLKLLDWHQRRDLRRSVHETVRTLWATYLRTWQHAAEHYAELYPKVRFCFRDYFLHSRHVAMVYDQVSYQAIAKIEKQLEEEGDNGDKNDEDESSLDDSNKKKPRAKRAPRKRKNAKQAAQVDESSTSPSSSDSDSYDLDDENEPFVKKSKKQKPNEEDEGIERNQATVIMPDIAKAHNPFKPTGMEVALTIQPTMELASAFLFLATYRAGVQAYQICRWINTGRIPLLNAFKLLSDSEQEKLKPSEKHFSMEQTFPAQRLEWLATRLAAVCRLHRRSEYMEPKFDYQIRFVTPTTAPVVAAQIVADMNLGQTVMNNCLALMGLPLPKAKDPDHPKEEHRLPTAFPLADPRILYKSDQVLVVVALACTLDPTWRQWNWVQPLESAKDRFIPWREVQLQRVGNGAQAQDYIDFFEETYVNPQKSVAAKLVGRLNAASRKLKDDASSTSSSDMDDVPPKSGGVRPCLHRSGAATELGPDGADASTDTTLSTDDTCWCRLVEALALNTDSDPVELKDLADRWLVLLYLQRLPRLALDLPSQDHLVMATRQRLLVTGHLGLQFGTADLHEAAAALLATFRSRADLCNRQFQNGTLPAGVIVNKQTQKYVRGQCQAVPQEFFHRVLTLPCPHRKQDRPLSTSN